MFILVAPLQKHVDSIDIAVMYKTHILDGIQISCNEKILSKNWCTKCISATDKNNKLVEY